MLLTDFDYDLPQELIAQTPCQKRDHSRLMVLNRNDESINHAHFFDLPKYLKEGDTLVFNNTRVIPARLIGKRETGGKVEVFLLRRTDGNRWEVLVKPGKKAQIGNIITFGDKGQLRCEIQEHTDFGGRVAEFFYDGIWEEVLDKLGQTPLPPYIHEKLQDKERYQTVYAKEDGSAAAPTAGLHFTEDLLSKLRAMKINLEFVTLHVGLGTFRPVNEENIEDHIMHTEYFHIDKDVADRINANRARGGRIIAVGTTSIRTLESAANDGGILKAQSAETGIYIYPGYKFKIVDGIITNFHLPKSTLIMLISAFAGREYVLRAYKKAVEEKYRFFSFGDAMLIL